MQRVHVVVPAHDEELLLPACLAGIEAAMAELRAVAPRVQVGCTVVLDRCTDASGAVAAGFPVRVVHVDAACVGIARAAGVLAARSSGRPARASRTWIACTDADTQVPRHWLTAQLALARIGHTLLVGRALPDPADLSPDDLARWSSLHRGARPGHHVHGANLGFRLDAYDAVGGFEPVAEHEDVRLVAALISAGSAVASSPAVLTSGRLVGRTPGGFAGYLADMRGHPALPVSSEIPARPVLT